MAKITLTLEDLRAGVASSLDMTQNRTGELAGQVPSRALLLGHVILGMLAQEQALHEVPRCSQLPPSSTLH